MFSSMRRGNRQGVVDRLRQLMLILVAAFTLPGQSPAQTDTFGPQNAAELACKLSAKANPTSYRYWWVSAVPNTPHYESWFWTEIVPHRDPHSRCDDDVREMFWAEA